MKINSYCIDCGTHIGHYNKATRCWYCYKKIKQQNSTYKIAYCMDCRVELKSSQAKRCITCDRIKRRGGKYSTFKICKECNSKCTGFNGLCRSCASKGERNAMYIDGRSKEDYGFEFSESLKQIVRKRDNYKCQLCNCTSLENNRELDVHHLDLNKSNNNIDNLIALCMKCHTTLHNNYRKQLIQL